ncbi:MAG: PKD domain-containing protein [Bacteroidota bacterium]|nr:PKD domain-containing protein [Bacteroidota bacterium]
MKSTRTFFKQLFKVFLFIALLSPTLFMSNCNKGSVEIFDIIDTVVNCSLPYVVHFYPDATYGSGDVDFEWDFGDGSSETIRTPVHIYENTGLYNVTLTITNKDAKESKNIALDLREESLPIIPFFEMEAGGPKNWAPTQMYFDNFSEHATSYYWDFGDGYSSILKNPEHIFAQEGDFTVSLGAICEGDTVFQTKNLSILPPPDDIYIDEVAVWLPSGFNNTELYCNVYYDIYTVDDEGPTVVASSFPVTFPIREEIFFFHGNWDDDILTFEIWEVGNANDPVYVFDIPMYRIQDNFYPSVLVWENGDYGAEVLVGYE